MLINPLLARGAVGPRHSRAHSEADVGAGGLQLLVDGAELALVAKVRLQPVVHVAAMRLLLLLLLVPAIAFLAVGYVLCVMISGGV